jgi:hypothetical protein
MEGHHLPAGIAEAGQVRIIGIKSRAIDLPAEMHDIVKPFVRHLGEVETRIPPVDEVRHPVQGQVVQFTNTSTRAAIRGGDTRQHKHTVALVTDVGTGG